MFWCASKHTRGFFKTDNALPQAYGLGESLYWSQSWRMDISEQLPNKAAIADPGTSP